MHRLTDAVHHDEHSITVTRLQSDGGLGSVGTLSVSLFQGNRHWYLNRLLIQAPYRRQGHGRQLFELLVSVLKRRASFNSDWPQPDSIIVEPGGYDSDPDELITFYQKLGFQN